MKSREIALISVMSALTVALAYSKVLTAPFLPGLIDFTSVIIFVNGFCFGYTVGGAIGGLSMAIEMLVPYPFANPAAWIFTISPILLIIMAGLGALYGIAGGFLGKRWRRDEPSRRFVIKTGLAGFTLTAIYQIFSSVGFYLAYPVYPSVWEAIYLTFVPLYYPYPPITQAFTNAIIFAIVAPTLILAIKKLPTQTRTTP